MVTEFIALFDKYLFVILSGLIGYILWHKLYNYDGSKKLRDDITYQLEWLNLSVVIFLLIYSLFTTVLILSVLYYNISINLAEISSYIIKYVKYTLLIGLILISAYLMNYKSTKKSLNKATNILRKFYFLFLSFFIGITIFLIFFDPVLNLFKHLYFNFLFLLVTGVYLFLIFKVNVYKKEIYLFLFLSLLIISITIIGNIFFINNITRTGEYIEEIECYEDSCHETLVKDYKVEQKLLNYFCNLC